MRARTKKKDGRAVSSPHNGRKGGRPTAWSYDVLAAAVACLRQHAGNQEARLSEEMIRLAGALENGTLRLRGRSLASLQTMPQPAEPPPPPTTNMRVIVTLRVSGGKSRRGLDRAVEEVFDGVLRPLKAKILEGWDYSLVVPCPTDEALDRLMSLAIPSQARSIAARRHCTVEYSARSVDEPQRTWIDATPVPPPQPRKRPFELALFAGRRGNKTVSEIETRVLSHHHAEKVPGKSGEYRLGIWCTDETIEREVAKLVDDMRAILPARRPLVSISYTLDTLELPRRTWSGTL